MKFWEKKKVVVTGGSGFLGQAVIEALKRKGVRRPFIVHSKEYDLRKQSAVCRLYKEQKPDLIIHLAATVGGIGANRENPGKYFYENMIMGLELIEQSIPCRIIFKITIWFSEQLNKPLRSEYLSNEVGIVHEPFE